jgi:hypothetical protein
MPLPTPNLDDRHFQDIVDEAKKRIPHYTKEWTDHNVSDPGVTLIELFAWMTDMTLYRLNQVPDLHYVRFLEMLGIHLNGPVPASVPVTFWLSAPQTVDVLIPAGTEVATTQTETEPSIIFTTDADLITRPPKLAAVFTRELSSDGKRVMKEHNLRRLETGFEGLDVFSDVPQVDDAIYFGFDTDISQHILGFDFDFDPAGGAGVDPSLPPYVFEASTGKEDERWSQCQIESDNTRGMNSIGRIRIFVPAIGRYAVNDQQRFWVRARVKEITPAENRDGMRPYRISPRLRKLGAASWGGTVNATHAQAVTREFVGRSDGTPGQRFFLKRTPVLARASGENLLVQAEGAPQQHWNEVHDFSASLSDQRHYTLDPLSGELRFGPAIRQPDGTIKLYGSVPARGANLVFERYRTGGGQVGNVQAGVINTLKTAIPFIARVTNREPAWGGLDAETLDAARMRAPAMLRSRDRAVTESDFEFLAMQAIPAAIGRVKCLQPSPGDGGRVVPGQVYVLVIPRVPRPAGFLEPAQLELPAGDARKLTAYLDERRLLTTRLDIRPPAYYWVSAKARLRPTPGAKAEEVQAAVLERLYAFLNPLTGGPEGKGWPFGRHLFVSDVYQCLQGLPNIQFIRAVELYTARPGGDAQGSPLETLEIVAHGVIASGKHSVEFV